MESGSQSVRDRDTLQTIADAAAQTIALPISEDEFRRTVTLLRVSSREAIELLVTVYRDAAGAMVAARSAFDSDAAIGLGSGALGRDSTGTVWLSAFDRRDAVFSQLYRGLESVIAAHETHFLPNALNRLRGRVLIDYLSPVRARSTGVLCEAPDVRALVTQVPLLAEPQVLDEVKIAALSSAVPLKGMASQCRDVLELYEAEVGRRAEHYAAQQRRAVASQSHSSHAATAIEIARWEIVLQARAAVDQIAAIVAAHYGAALALEFEGRMQELMWPTLFARSGGWAIAQGQDVPILRDCVTDAARGALVQFRRRVLSAVTACVQRGEHPLPPHGDYAPEELSEFQLLVLSGEREFVEKHLSRVRVP
jgi:hypothetical protein